MAPTVSLSDVSPVFTEIVKSIYGEAVDPREAWDLAKSMPGVSDVHVDGTDAEKRKRERKLALTGLGATTVAGVAGVHAVKATTVENAARKAEVASGKVPKSVDKVARLVRVSPAKAATVVGGGLLALHGVELAGDALGARAQTQQLKDLKKPKQPVAKAFRLKPVNPGAVRRTVSLRAKKPAQAPVVKSFTWSGTVSELDRERQQVFGWASVSEVNGKEVIDRQGDIMPIEEVEKAAYDFVIECRVGGDQHRRIAKSDTQPYKAADLIESMVFTDDKVKALRLPDSFPRGWWIGMQIHDPQVWQDYKDGKRTGFSVHGTGRREPVEMVAKAAKLRERVDAAANPPKVVLRPVESSAIRAMGYQRQTHRLAIEMNSRPDEPYEYRLKPKDAKAAETAPSLGHHYATQIRGKAKRATRYTAADRARLFANPPDRVKKGAIAATADAAGDVAAGTMRLKATGKTAATQTTQAPAKRKPVLKPLVQSLTNPVPPPAPLGAALNQAS